MKIIKAASFEWSQKVSCSNCRSELELDLSDLTLQTNGDPRDQYCSDYYSYKCPVCEMIMSLEFGAVPIHVRRLVGKKS